MEYQKITHLLNESIKKPSEFKPKTGLKLTMMHLGIIKQTVKLKQN